jgi:LPS sulfotransferase NodH
MTRLVPNPVFILSSIRSGSTLLRCILDTHTRLHAPHELHLTDVTVTLASPYAELAMGAAGLDANELEHLLWDRLLHRSLTASGKDQIIDKTPGNALRWQRLVACWPHARFIFLRRDPERILASAYAANPARDRDDTRDIVERLIAGVDDAQANLPGAAVRYEELTSDPQHVVAKLCEYLGVAFEEAMLTYRVPEHLVPGIGDFTEKIRTGRIQP